MRDILGQAASARHCGRISKLLLATLAASLIDSGASLAQVNDLDIWVDSNFDGLPGPNRGNFIQIGEIDSFDVYIDSHEFAWTNFLFYGSLADPAGPAYFAADTANVQVQYFISGGLVFPEDNFSWPNTIGLGGFGFPEQSGVLRLARVALRAIAYSPWNAATFWPKVDPQDPSGVFCQLGNGSSYGLFEDGFVSGARCSVLPIDGTPTSLTVSPEDPIIGLWHSLPLSAIGIYFDGSGVDLTQIVEWTSCDTNIVTVDSLGVVRGRGVTGSVAIRARALPVEDSITLTIDAVVGVDPPRQPNELGSRAMVAFPNPARGGEATLVFRAPERNAQGSTSIEIYDSTGRHVRSLLETRLTTAGLCESRWDGRDRNGNAVAPGLYLVRVQAPNVPIATERIVVVP